MPTLITLLDPATETAIKWKGVLVNSSKVGGRGGGREGWGWRNNYTIVTYTHWPKMWDAQWGHTLVSSKPEERVTVNQLIFNIILFIPELGVVRDGEREGEGKGGGTY